MKEEASCGVSRIVHIAKLYTYLKFFDFTLLKYELCVDHICKKKCLQTP